MDEEFIALTRQRTWILVPPSPTQNVVGCKWVFKLKHNNDGSISRYKARLVAKCNTMFLRNEACTSICGDVLHFYSHIFQLLVVFQLMLCIYMIGITSDLFNEAMTICLLPGVIVDSYSFINAAIKC